jgi:hypothetical protein
MTVSATNDPAKAAPRSAEKRAIIALKFGVTALCFWYLSRQVDISDVSQSLALLDFSWVALAVMTVVLQIPLVALRWLAILNALAAGDQPLTKRRITVITAIGLFFAQVLPNVAGEGIRAWYLVRFGSDWRNAITSVLIDRGVGVGAMITLAFLILLLSPGSSDLGGYRGTALMLYAGVLLSGTAVLALLPALLPLLNRVRYLHWVVQFAADARRVLLGRKIPLILALAFLIHALTIFIIWSLARAQGLMLPLSDVALLFVVMLGVALVPASINGWGLREIAVVGLLGRYGVPPEQALVFSVCFGLTLAIGSLPGAILWLLYPVAPGNTLSSANDRSQPYRSSTRR